MLEVRDLHKFYGGFHAVRGISFSVQSGEVIGFLGPNGAGKTTTMKIITGFLAMTAGEVKVDGLDVVEDSLETRRRIGYLPENAPLYDDMTVLEYLDFVADVRGVTGARRRERTAYVIDACALGSKRRAVIKTLSKGYRQRVGLAQAIIHEPKLVILDEPTVGLDPNQIIEIRELIKTIAKTGTVILSSHILAEVEATCSRVMIIDHGQLVANAKPGELSREHARAGAYTIVVGSGGLDPREAIAAIGGGIIVQSSVAEGDRHRVTLTADAATDVVDRILALARSKGWAVPEIRPDHPTLEDVFKKLTRQAAAVAN